MAKTRAAARAEGQQEDQALAKETKVSNDRVTKPKREVKTRQPRATAGKKAAEEQEKSSPEPEKEVRRKRKSDVASPAAAAAAADQEETKKETQKSPAVSKEQADQVMKENDGAPNSPKRTPKRTSKRNSKAPSSPASPKEPKGASTSGADKMDVDVPKSPSPTKAEPTSKEVPTAAGSDSASRPSSPDSSAKAPEPTADGEEKAEPKPKKRRRNSRREKEEMKTKKRKEPSPRMQAKRLRRKERRMAERIAKKMVEMGNIGFDQPTKEDDTEQNGTNEQNRKGRRRLRLIEQQRKALQKALNLGPGETSEQLESQLERWTENWDTAAAMRAIKKLQKKQKLMAKEHAKRIRTMQLKKEKAAMDAKAVKQEKIKQMGDKMSEKPHLKLR
ncbi:hypothetical protein PFICI_11010 [Pestalotiopsis fici W106-1]|uniref:Uncharacterized protein n=1 Tax=Pestalotiopsis fici (strain W106-1 / CGMCC3.15140) TaxID=1229662 RepID=W3WWA2_PESFW|nr:uncharacterized protein PFICI_11010 [Pestalotiopsis fici W106-1]ETS77136.1 hypothetical protein PFICI_11010 [Pestalotiopsis fici W106-1]